mgnify:CR=1 FL=1
MSIWVQFIAFRNDFELLRRQISQMTFDNFALISIDPRVTKAFDFNIIKTRPGRKFINFMSRRHLIAYVAKSHENEWNKKHETPAKQKPYG